MKTKSMEEDMTCRISFVHKDRVDRVRAAMPDQDKLAYLADFFKIFGDLTRTKILLALEKGELCVCDLQALLDMSQSAVSHQLRYLKNYRVVKTRREGKVVYYSLDDDHINQILKCGLDHTLEETNAEGQ